MDNLPVRAVIDLSAIAHNVQELKRITDQNSRFMAVVKADGYGHGAVQTACAALENGADNIGVARLSEGIALREAGISAPILILSPNIANIAHELIHHRLTQTVTDLSVAQALSAAAQSQGTQIPIHIKIDTGMGRIGIIPSSLLAARPESNKAIEEITAIAALKGLTLEGIYTHFASSDSLDKTYALNQLDCFLNFVNQLHQLGIEIPIKHAANSGAIIAMPQSHLGMVRAGIAIYGLYPSNDVDRIKVRLIPALTLQTTIIQLKQVPAGFKISYNSTYETPKPTTIAAVPLGYGDGYSRLLSNKGYMLVRGQKAPILGRVCMDLTILDVGHIADAALGDEVTAIGKQEKNEITADEIANLTNTINYEVVSALTSRIPRVYINSKS